MKEKTYPTLDEAIAAIAHKSIEDLVAEARQQVGPGLISADQLRAPAPSIFRRAWRKSLSVEQDRLPLFGDDEVPTKQESPPAQSSDARKRNDD